MRISIWQQFSSNHSAAFTVVGMFETENQAVAAATEMKAILTKTEDWWEGLSREDRLAWGEKTETPELTPPEIELSARYNVEWPFAINWYHWEWDRDTSYITVFQNFLFVQSPHPYIWYGPQPINGLMLRLGGEVAVYASESRSYPDTILLADLTCNAPDEATSQLIEVAVNSYINNDEGAPIPWLVYHSGALDVRAEELKQVEAQALHDWPIEEKVYKENSELHRRILRARIERDEAQIALLTEQYKALEREALGGKEPIDWSAEYGWVLAAMSRTHLDMEFVEDYPALQIGVYRNGTSLQFTGLNFESWITGLQALYAWLEALECSEITYKFWQMRDSRSNELT